MFYFQLNQTENTTMFNEFLISEREMITQQIFIRIECSVFMHKEMLFPSLSSCFIQLFIRSFVVF